MKPMTPRGTRTREISRPLGRRHVSTTWPTGSGNAATWRSPCAISSIRASVSVNRSRKARVRPLPRARSRSARLATRRASVFSSRPRAIWVRASFLTLVERTARATAASRAARALPATRLFTSMFNGPSQDHEIIAMNDLVETPVAEAALDDLGLGAPDLPQLVGVEVPQPARELPAPGHHRHQLAGGEPAVDVDHARGQQALAPLGEGGEGALVHAQTALGRHRERDPALARREAIRPRGEEGA